MPAPVTWDSLNERQRTYLQTVYEVDQETEHYIRLRAAQGYWSRVPASEWRWMAYNAANATLYDRLYLRKLVDPGSGSTFEALASRKLILRKWEYDGLGGSILFVQITRAGRKLVRDALGLSPYRKGKQEKIPTEE